MMHSSKHEEVEWSRDRADAAGSIRFSERSTRAMARFWMDLIRSEPLLREEESMASKEERRKWFRVPMSGHIRWQSKSGFGDCVIRDISPGGAALELPLPKVFQLGGNLALDMDLLPDLKWHVTERAKVVRKVPRPDGTCEIGVRFSEAEGADREARSDGHCRA